MRSSGRNDVMRRPIGIAVGAVAVVSLLGGCSDHATSEARRPESPAPATTAETGTTTPGGLGPDGSASIPTQRGPSAPPTQDAARAAWLEGAGRLGRGADAGASSRLQGASAGSRAA